MECRHIYVYTKDSRGVLRFRLSYIYIIYFCICIDYESLTHGIHIQKKTFQIIPATCTPTSAASASSPTAASQCVATLATRLSTPPTARSTVSTLANIDSCLSLMDVNGGEIIHQLIKPFLFFITIKIKCDMFKHMDMLLLYGFLNHNFLYDLDEWSTLLGAQTGYAGYGFNKSSQLGPGRAGRIAIGW